MDNDKVLYFGVKSIVKGDFALKAPIVSNNFGYQVSLFIEDDVYKISIIRRIPNDSPLVLNHQIRNGVINYIAPQETDYIDFIKQLQYIESIGGCYYNIAKIFYDEHLELIWFTGGEMFNNLIQIFSLQKEYKARDKKLLTERSISNILVLNRIVPDANIPCNYFREANNYLHNREYRLAYIHFYMIVEYCFANGKFGKKEQVTEFIKSKELCFALLDSIKSFKTHSPQQYAWLESEVDNKYGSFTIKNVFNYLVWQRGLLAHASTRSAKYVFNEKGLHNITVFISIMSLLICGNFQVYCMSSQKSKDKRLSERYESLKNELGINVE